MAGISENMRVKVAVGNQHAEFVTRVMALVFKHNLLWIENPDGSPAWLYPHFQQTGIGRQENTHRFDSAVITHPKEDQSSYKL